MVADALSRMKTVETSENIVKVHTPNLHAMVTDIRGNGCINFDHLVRNQETAWGMTSNSMATTGLELIDIDIDSSVPLCGMYMGAPRPVTAIP